MVSSFPRDYCRSLWGLVEQLPAKGRAPRGCTLAGQLSLLLQTMHVVKGLTAMLCYAMLFSGRARGREGLGYVAGARVVDGGGSVVGSHTVT